MMGGESNTMYIALIGIAGFTGILCWVGILYSQIIFRKRLKARGYDWREALCALILIVTAILTVVSFFAINANLAEFGEGYNVFTSRDMKRVWTYLFILIATYVVIFAGVVRLNKFRRSGSSDSGQITQ